MSLTNDHASMEWTTLHPRSAFASRHNNRPPSPLAVEGSSTTLSNASSPSHSGSSWALMSSSTNHTAKEHRRRENSLHNVVIQAQTLADARVNNDTECIRLCRKARQHIDLYATLPPAGFSSVHGLDRFREVGRIVPRVLRSPSTTSCSFTCSNTPSKGCRPAHPLARGARGASRLRRTLQKMLERAGGRVMEEYEDI